MEAKYKLGLSIFGVSSLMLLTIATTLNSSHFNTFNRAKGDNTVTVVTQDMLDATRLYDFDIKGTGEKNQIDSRFQIALANDKCIDGAIIYRDCGQQFVGDYLGDRVGIHNNSGVAQAYNFNFLFSFENNIESFSAEYSVEMELDKNGSGDEHYQVQIKCSTDSMITDFYDDLESKYDYDYSMLTEKADTYAQTVKSIYVNSWKYHTEADNTLSAGGSVTNQQIHFDFAENYRKNVVGLQFTYWNTDSNFIKGYKWLRFKLNRLEFSYSCNN